ncbi:D-amino-acid transaminase [Oceanobacillus piezotolerans]|uniref:D-alanine aminotransferase n=1 Tax=Oceanobacillus piezotolerans TaxID=2448030 RepID=A0A498DEZ3_9BACI|nr:D-amino-acid transaminase [Oceanobacillus piezotolerans]RLL47778.1 D-amino-acid transaminase [Oceanobacillus piezotolerans]
MGTKMLFNDSIMDRKKVIDIEDRGYQFGDGIYEVVGIYNGRAFLLDEHLERLQRSAKELKINIPYSVNRLKEQLLELVKINGLKEGVIYLQISRGVAERWHQFPVEEVAPVLVAYTKEEETLKEEEDNGATAILTQDIRWLRCDIKTLNLLPNVLGKQKATEKQAVEAIFHRGDIITEASASNVFIVKGSVLYTHPANHFILNGITRRKVIDLCNELDLDVREETYSVSDLLSADEVFITATKLDIVPIIRIDEVLIGEGIPGKYTTRILQAYRDIIRETSNENGVS